MARDWEHIMPSKAGLMIQLPIPDDDTPSYSTKVDEALDCLHVSPRYSTNGLNNKPWTQRSCWLSDCARSSVRFGVAPLVKLDHTDKVCWVWWRTPLEQTHCQRRRWSYHCAAHDTWWETRRICTYLGSWRRVTGKCITCDTGRAIYNNLCFI